MTELVRIGEDYHAKIKKYCESNNLAIADFTRRALDRAMGNSYVDDRKVVYVHTKKLNMNDLEPYHYNPADVNKPMPEHGARISDPLLEPVSQDPGVLLEAIEPGGKYWHKATHSYARGILAIMNRDHFSHASLGILADINKYALSVYREPDNGRYYPACDVSKSIISILDIHCRLDEKKKTHGRDSFSPLDIKYLYYHGWVINYV